MQLAPRVTTALILIPVMLGGIFLLPLPAFSVFIGFIAAVGAWEWAALSGLYSARSRSAYAGSILFLLVLLYLGVTHRSMPLAWMLLVTAMLWLVGLFFVAIYPKGPPLFSGRVCRMALGWVVLGGMWLGFYSLRAEDNGRWLLLLLMGVVWGADIGAYYAGRRFGRHKLAPRVSPGKTWEGVAGGVLGAALLSLVLLIAGLPHQVASFAQLALLALMAILVVAASIVGDLVESMVKRSAGSKDSGSLLPGHGGVLDRIDSMSAAAPVLAAYLYYWPAL